MRSGLLYISVTSHTGCLQEKYLFARFSGVGVSFVILLAENHRVVFNGDDTGLRADLWFFVGVSVFA